MAPPRADNPSKWKKTDYFATATGWAYCDSVYNGASMTATLAMSDTETGFSATNATHGCGGQFSHTALTPYSMPLAGTWTTNYGQTLTITSAEWKSESSYGTSISRIEAYGADWVLMQNAADDAYNPSKWTYVQWHTTSGGGIGYCATIYNGASVAATLATDTSTLYIASNATHGCGASQFSHTLATRT